MPDELDVSDEATNLPPLEEVNPMATLVALSWVLGQKTEGVVNGVNVPLSILSLRGIQFIAEDSEDAGWVQIHLAFPDETLREILTGWLELLDSGEIVGNDTP